MSIYVDLCNNVLILIEKYYEAIKYYETTSNIVQLQTYFSELPHEGNYQKWNGKTLKMDIMYNGKMVRPNEIDGYNVNDLYLIMNLCLTSLTPSFRASTITNYGQIDKIKLDPPLKAIESVISILRDKIIQGQ